MQGCQNLKPEIVPGGASASSAVPKLEEKGLHLLSFSTSRLQFNRWLILYYISFVQEMLQYEPSKRISAKKAMEHPYFDDLDKTYL
ncbi:hypothetical protein Leryth_019180 [Lithospermum erythrorhizon]|nr:hypothetical protein Leryth_019180 [Lithospermum erythrorhizon]